MGRSGIRQQDVYMTADIIAAQGNVPTMHAIRKILGSGSCSTIHKHLQSWKFAKMLSKEPAHKGSYVSYLFNENLVLKQQIQRLTDELHVYKALQTQCKPQPSLIAKLWNMVTNRNILQVTDHTTSDLTSS